MTVTTKEPMPKVSTSLGPVADAFVASTILVLIILEIWLIGVGDPAVLHRVVATVLAPVVALPVAFRANRPMRPFLINLVGTLVMIAIGYSSGVYQWANLILLFTVAAACRGKESVLALVLGLGGVAYYFVAFSAEGRGAGLMVLALWFAVWSVGRVYGARAIEEQLRLERNLVAELAATRQERLELEAQRTRMARELHDLIGHTVNVMVVHAGAGRRAVRTDPDGAEQAFGTIETTGRAALDELDRVLGVLRSEDPEAPLAPLPGLSDLPSLLGEFNRADLQTALTVSGPTEAVAAGLGLTVYRIVQEALTNTLKHAAAERSEVSILIDGSRVRVAISDDGRGGATPDSDAGIAAGRGHRGIIERVQLHGGQVSFESQNGSGYRITCDLPLTRADAPR